MKLKFLKPALLLLVIVAFAACEKQEDMAVTDLSSAGSAGISASASTIVLTKSTKDADALKLTLTAADYGYAAAVKYTIQFALKGTNFSNPKEFTIDANALEKSFKGLDLNDIALALGIPAESLGTLEVRVKSEISNSITPLYSAVIELKVTPFALISFVYVPGDYQGWNPSTADSLISALGDGKYEGVINFSVNPAGSGKFKITPKKAWDVAYGDAGGGKVSTTGSDLTAPTLYPYKLKLNLNDNTLTMEKYSWGLIGDATPGGWNDDTDMSYNNGTREWAVTLALVGGKNIKFRLNDDWGTNYGDTGADKTLESGGADIAVATSGNYKVTMNLVTMTYTLTKL